MEKLISVVSPWLFEKTSLTFRSYLPALSIVQPAGSERLVEEGRH